MKISKLNFFLISSVLIIFLSGCGDSSTKEPDYLTLTFGYAEQISELLATGSDIARNGENNEKWQTEIELWNIKYKDLEENVFSIEPPVEYKDAHSDLRMSVRELTIIQETLERTVIDGEAGHLVLASAFQGASDYLDTYNNKIELAHLKE